jgi:1-deoxy-D-xylulose-5-phosphate reductoisomerase
MDKITNLVILGSTGSIGRQTLAIVRAFPERFRVLGLAASRNLTLLDKQAAEFRPLFLYFEKEKSDNLETKCRFLSLEEMASHPQVDMVVVATAGNAGLLPTLAAAKAGKKIALANKETLVMAGGLVMTEAGRTGAQILPVDSEHSAIWQCLNGENAKPTRFILTASGGPFRELSLAEQERVSVEQALAHPSWRMGRKITIDSATLINKGLEVVEAHWLFGMPYEKIMVLIHPESIVHSMVEFADGSVKAQLSQPDMRLPIQYALTYPERLANQELPRLRWESLASLSFEPPDTERFPCLSLAIKAGEQGETYPAVLSGADEAAVALFLSGRICFTDIHRLVAQTLAEHQPTAQPTLEEIMAADAWAKDRVATLVGGNR